MNGYVHVAAETVLWPSKVYYFPCIAVRAEIKVYTKTTYYGQMNLIGTNADAMNTDGVNDLGDYAVYCMNSDLQSNTGWTS